VVPKISDIRRCVKSDRLSLVAGLDAGSVLLGGEVFDFEVLSSGIGAVLSLSRPGGAMTGNSEAGLDAVV
jgi:hypothetical protein